jgi:hypothetical protein
MDPNARRLAVLLCPIIMAASCHSSGQQRATQLLDQRLQAELAPDIAAGKAALQPLPDGARVTLLDTSSSFPNDVGALTDRRPDIRSNVIEGLLDPKLMRIQVTDTSTLPADQRDARVQNVVQYFVANGLGSTLGPATPQQATLPGSADTAPAGLRITISVQCPHHDGAGYDSGDANPAC